MSEDIDKIEAGERREQVLGIELVEYTPTPDEQSMTDIIETRSARDICVTEIIEAFTLFVDDTPIRFSDIKEYLFEHNKDPERQLWRDAISSLVFQGYVVKSGTSPTIDYMRTDKPDDQPVYVPVPESERSTSKRPSVTTQLEEANAEIEALREQVDEMRDQISVNELLSMLSMHDDHARLTALDFMKLMTR